MASFLPASLHPAFRALAEALVPDTVHASPEEWALLEATIARSVRARPAALGRQLALFVAVLSGLARLRYGRPLERLDVRRRTALLAALERAPFLLLRRGVWGLRTLVLMGWYTQPRIAAEIGYRASPEGWGARR